MDLPDIQFFDQLMLDSSRFFALIDSPESINTRVIVDEIQKFPKLLDIAHSQIQKRKRQFIMTGSSSRRLKQQGSNLLAGRAWVYNLYPLSSRELGDAFKLKKSLEFGSLPESYLSPNSQAAREYLNAYVSTYLQKEIQQEQWVRKIEPFLKFLAVAAQMNGQIINKSKIGREVGIDDVSVANYFEIPEDTLLGFLLPVYSQSVRKSQRQAPKFYFIDPGVKRALGRTLTVELLPQTTSYGDAFEQRVIIEIIKGASYARLDWIYSFARTKDDVEIDLLIARPGKKLLQIEIKSKTQVTEADAKSLETLGRDIDKHSDRWLLSNDPLEQKFGSTRAMPWRKAIEILFE